MTRPRIACLHSAASNASLFDAAAAGLDLALMHTMRPDLLAAAETGPAPLAETAELLAALARDSDGVLLTCSTLGPAVGLVKIATPVLRADAMLARHAGPDLLVLYAARATEASTRALFTGAELRQVPGAWDDFRAGRLDAYYDRIAVAADAAFAEGKRRLALVQVSMAPAAGRCRNGVPMTVPQAALAGILGVLDR